MVTSVAGDRRKADDGAFNQDGGCGDWPQMDQSADTPDDPWD